MYPQCFSNKDCRAHSQTGQEPHYEDDSQIKQLQLLKEDVKKMLVSPFDKNLSSKLKFIDLIQRLGVSYHFEHEIDGVLRQIYDTSTKNNNIIIHDDLHQLALLFRLLRQHGYPISSDVFYKFKEETGKFNERLANDIQGMISFYEAAQLRFHGEEILEEAHHFTRIHLTKSLTTQWSPSLVAQVNHTLWQSLHRGVPMVLHQKEVSSVTKWWIKDLNVSTKLPFVRDRIVEGCFWILGVYFEPQYSLARRIMMKLVGILTIIDDIYDAYGTIDELELFTNAIERWDICFLDDLPEYMKLCYTTILDVFEEIEQEMKKQGKTYYIKYAKKEMKKMVQAHMIEARWFHCNHTPTVDEYMEVTTISSCYPVMIIISFIGMEDITEEILMWATSDPMIIIATSTICRFMDDIAGNE
ncbi:putative terpene synthase 2, partial [Mucuna pruriens]